jgi:DNA mismatch endonuclease (patch repair protein)
MKSKYQKGTRSYTMSRIRSKDTKPEMIVRRFLYHHGFRYKLHVKELPGKPDIVLQKYKTVIFVHGCFWHSHSECRHRRFPKTNIEYWKPKLEKNVARDTISYIELYRMGYQVIVVYECELQHKIAEKTLNCLLEMLTSC